VTASNVSLFRPVTSTRWRRFAKTVFPDFNLLVLGVPRGMLVISRRAEERILIGDDVEIIVLETSRGTVKLGIRAPRHIEVIRAELGETETPKARTPVGGLPGLK
jgi:carbon storage regulator